MERRGGLLPIPAMDLGSSESLSPFSVAEAEQFHRNLGHSVRIYRDRPWFGTRRRSWNPVEPLRALAPEEIGWPRYDALRYKAVVRDPASATVTMRAVVVKELPQYDEQRLTRDRRRELRSALRSFDYRTLDAPDLLEQQGHPVARESGRRTSQRVHKDGASYLKYVRGMFAGPKPLVVAASHEGHLAGYMMSFAVQDKLVLQDLNVADQYLRQHVTVGLYWHTLRLWAATGAVQTALTGLAVPPPSGVDSFKRTIGAEIICLPAIAKTRAPVDRALRVLRPDVHERFL